MCISRVTLASPLNNLAGKVSQMKEALETSDKTQSLSYTMITCIIKYAKYDYKSQLWIQLYF